MQYLNAPFGLFNNLFGRGRIPTETRTSSRTTSDNYLENFVENHIEVVRDKVLGTS